MLGNSFAYWLGKWKRKFINLRYLKLLIHWIWKKTKTACLRLHWTSRENDSSLFWGTLLLNAVSRLIPGLLLHNVKSTSIFCKLSETCFWAWRHTPRLFPSQQSVNGMSVCPSLYWTGNYSLLAESQQQAWQPLVKTVFRLAIKQWPSPVWAALRTATTWEHFARCMIICTRGLICKKLWRFLTGHLWERHRA